MIEHHAEGDERRGVGTDAGEVGRDRLAENGFRAHARDARGQVDGLDDLGGAHRREHHRPRVESGGEDRFGERLCGVLRAETEDDGEPAVGGECVEQTEELRAVGGAAPPEQLLDLVHDEEAGAVSSTGRRRDDIGRGDQIRAGGVPSNADLSRPTAAASDATASDPGVSSTVDASTRSVRVRSPDARTSGIRPGRRSEVLPDPDGPSSTTVPSPVVTRRCRRRRRSVRPANTAASASV